MQQLRESLQSVQFDVVLTNPPFSMTKESKNPSERRVLEQYNLARKGDTSASLRTSLRSSIMFTERYCDLLRPGGKLITVIDDTVLASDQEQFRTARKFIREQFLIRAIISLPGDTFRRSGSRVKTSVLVLEKKASPQDQQPNWYHFFAEHLGVDDLSPKASDYDVQEARKRADRETEEILSGYHAYLAGGTSQNILGPRTVIDRLDLKHCVPMFGRMARKWRTDGIEVKELSSIVRPIEDVIRPAIEFPDEVFTLIKVSYEGRCEVEGQKPGRRVRNESMYRVKAGQLVFSGIRATDGAVGIVPSEMDGAIVRVETYTIFDCGSPEDSAYLWSVLRSHELRADMQSLSPGSGRYRTYWPDVGKLLIPWLPDDERKAVGENLLRLWQQEKDLVLARKSAMSAVEALGVESQSSIKRWKASKAPQ